MGVKAGCVFSVGAVVGAVCGTHSGVSIGVSRLSLVPAGRKVISGVCWTRKFLIELPVPRGWKFVGLELILYVVKGRGILK